MSAPSTIDILNRLLVVHYRSLAMYLSFATPWVGRGREDAAKVVVTIAEHHKALVERLGAMVLDLGGTLEYGHFPMQFTALHDVSLEYLLKLLLQRQEKEVALIGSLADQLRFAPLAHALALEALGESKAHFDMLREVAAKPSSQPALV